MPVKRPPSGEHVPATEFKRDKRRKHPQLQLGRLRWLLTNTAMGMKEIGHTMKITEGTAKTYAVRLYRKEKVAGRTELMAREIQRLTQHLTVWRLTA